MSIQEYDELLRQDDLNLLVKLVSEMSWRAKIALRKELEAKNYPYYLRHLYFDFRENVWF